MLSFGSPLGQPKGKKEELEVINKISAFTQILPENLSDEDKIDLALHLNRLYDIFKGKSEGAFIKSRRRWLEEGEQHSSYFLKLEKSQAKFNSM